MKMLGLHGLINDLRDVDEHHVLKKLKENAHFSLSYLLLILSSTVICTLGLLLGSAPIVIGGMLISPLMWPLMKIAFGVSYELKGFIKQSISLLILSIILILLFSFLITYFSPIKLVNPEIISRTNPTLLDLFVALAAGAIATSAIMQKKISDSLAGVAIATSLVPPLCVSGIGIALFNFQIASGAFLLFLANVVSIIFIAVFVFIFSGIKRNSKKPIRQRGIILVSIILLLTSIPLIILLTNYSFKTKAYSISQDVLSRYFAAISKEISVQNVKTTIEKKEGEDTVSINADVLIPEEIILDYNQKNEIIQQLETKLQKKIDLNLRIEKSITLQSKDTIIYDSQKQTLINTFKEKLLQIDNTITISSLDVYSNDYNPYWHVNAVLLSNPNVSFTEKQREKIEKTLQQKIHQVVILDVELLPRLKLLSQPDLEDEKIKKDIETFLEAFQTIDIESIRLQNNEGSAPSKKEYVAIITLLVPKEFSFPPKSIYQLKDSLKQKYKKDIKIHLILTEKTTLEI